MIIQERQAQVAIGYDSQQGQPYFALKLLLIYSYSILLRPVPVAPPSSTELLSILSFLDATRSNHI